MLRRSDLLARNRTSLIAIVTFLIIGCLLATGDLNAQDDCDFCQDEIVEFFLTSDVQDPSTGPVPGDQICYQVGVNNFCGISIFVFTITYSFETLEFVSANTDIAQIPLFDQASVVANPNGLRDNITVAFFPLTTVSVVSKNDGDTILELCFNVIGDVGEDIRVEVGAKNLADPNIQATKTDEDGDLCPGLTEFGASVPGPDPLPTVIQSTCAGGIEVFSNVQCGSVPGESLGIAEVQMFCGVGPYEIVVDGTETFNTPDSVFIVTGLTSGLHDFVVTDQGTGTTIANPLQVDIPPTPGLTPDLDFILPLCADPAFTPRGQVILNSVTGGTPFSDGTYFFDWGAAENGRNYIPDRFASGIFNVTISDSLGCSVEREFDLRVDSIIVSVDDITLAQCDGSNTGSVSLTATGGAGDSDGFEFFIQGTSTLGDPVNDRMRSTNAQGLLDGIPPGAYRVWAEDDDVQTGLCNPITLDIVIESQQMYNINALPNTGLMCPAGENGINIEVSRTVDVAGNDISYQIFDLSDGSLASSMSPTGNLVLEECLPQGMYEIQLMDTDGCTFVDSFVVDGCALQVLPSEIPPDCPGIDDGSILLSVLDATDPVQFNWSDGSTDQNRIDLAPGTYEVEVSDGALCTLSLSFLFPEPDGFDIEFDFAPIDCPGGTTSITAIPQGGEAPFEFEWDPDPNGIIDPTLANVPAGTYFVTVFDDVGCSALDSITITDPELPEVMVEDGPRAPSCEGETDGFVQLSVVPTPEFPGPFIFRSPSGNTVQGDFSVQINDLEQGDQFVIIESLSGCVIETFEVEIPGGVGLQIDIQNSSIPSALCADEEVGVNLMATSAANVTTFEWLDPVNVDGPFAFVSPGEYEVLLTSGNCSSLDTVVVEGPEPFTSVIDPNLSSIGLCDGDLSDLVSVQAGGTMPYVIRWTLGGQLISMDSVLTGAEPGLYRLMSIDALGCAALADEITVGDVEPVEGTIGEVIQPTCFGDEGQVFIDTSSIMGGNGPYRYVIDALQPEDVLDTVSLPASTTPYQAVIFDVNGCSSEPTPFNIDVPEEVSVTISGDTLIDIGFTGELRVDVVTNVPIDTIIWSTNNESGESIMCLNGDCSEISIAPIGDVTFTATIINEEGCTASAEIDVDVVRNERIYIPNIFKAGPGIVNDERNRFFQIFPGSAVEDIDYLRIFDRWGNLVHEEIDLPLPVGNSGTGSWDGTYSATANPGDALNSGVYVYVVQVRFLGNPDPIVLKGDVTLIR